jgi:hypothetical protein
MKEADKVVGMEVEQKGKWDTEVEEGVAGLQLWVWRQMQLLVHQIVGHLVAVSRHELGSGAGEGHRMNREIDEDGIGHGWGYR